MLFSEKSVTIEPKMPLTFRALEFTLNTVYLSPEKKYYSYFYCHREVPGNWGIELQSW